MKKTDINDFEPVADDLKAKLADRLQQNELAKSMGFEVVELKKDLCVMTLDYRENITNGLKSRGTIHGGIVASLVDVAGAYALATNFDGQMSFATIDLHINFLKRALTKIYAYAYVIRKGSRINVIESNVYDERDSLVAKAVINFILTKPMVFK